MPVARTRNRDNREYFTGKRYSQLASPPIQTSFLRYSGSWGTCQDTVGNFGSVNALRIENKFAFTPVMNGEKYVLIGGKQVLDRAFYDHPIDMEVSPLVNPVNRFATLTDTQRRLMAWQALAKANPSAPTVSVPTILAELKDLPELYEQIRRIPGDLRRIYYVLRNFPQMVRNWGQRVLKTVSRNHIMWRWGVNPLLHDLSKMLDYVADADQRLKQLSKLKETGSLRTRTNMGEERISDPETVVSIHSNLDLVDARRTTTTTRKMWHVVRWNTTAFTNIPWNMDDRLSEARRLIWGVTGYEATAALWEILPWTWFIDWFANVGTVIQANNNTLNLNHVGSCIMCHTESETLWTVIKKGSWNTISGNPYAFWSIKERWGANPTASLPLSPTPLSIFTAKQWSILASLWMLSPRSRGRLPR